ncbi:MAG: hypothetical protein J6I64_08665 [Lachnospiraceae bacterium]|nr:hypothetical protein [Lachnospiraceae bacterium]
MKRYGSRFLSFLFPSILAVGVMLWFLSALSNLGQGHAAEDKQQLEQALTRAAVACYAAEGVYPPDVAYLEEHYGIQIDHSLYTVKYEVIASNLMPDITVLENQP